MFYIYFKPLVEDGKLNRAFAKLNSDGKLEMTDKLQNASPYSDTEHADKSISENKTEIAKAGYKSQVIEGRLAHLVRMRNV